MNYSYFSQALTLLSIEAHWLFSYTDDAGAIYALTHMDNSLETL